MENMKTAADLMIRDVCYADIDHPMSYIRQRMLVNAFSYLPVIKTDRSVWMLSDFAIARWLRQMSWEQQKGALVRTLKTVVEDTADSLELVKPISLPSETSIADLAKSLSSMPILLHEPKNKKKIVGLISAFDLL